jgi:hypothetical protein
MFDFTLSLQPVVQFMTLLPAPCFEELVSTFADEVRKAFDRTATRVRAIVHLLQFPTSGNLRDYSHIQSPPLSPTTPILGPVEAQRNRCPLAATQPDGSTASEFSNSFVNIVGFSPSEGEAVATQAKESGETIARCFNSGEELMRGMGAAVLMTLGGMVVHSRNTG